ncbi:MAG: hypothetical protein Q7T13_09925 [Polaromonas sp.]|nr:hypothetical protein [Polaromonas sp.]
MSNSFALGSFDHTGDWTPLKAENHGSTLLKNRTMRKSVALSRPAGQAGMAAL